MDEALRSDISSAEAPEPEYLLLEHFEPHVGKIFRFEGTRYAIPLMKIFSSPRPVPEWMKRRPFTLVFRASKEPEWLAEGLYRCSIDGGPTYTLYVAPIHTPQPQFQDYQAVFN